LAARSNAASALSRGAQPASNDAKRNRHVAAAVVREVYLRDQARCSFVSEGGRRCGERAFLELDHVTPFAVGGASTPDNLRLLCRQHNQQHARDYFGRAYIDAVIAYRRPETPATEPRI
jgi:5-methylcytosine-specific restriction endonuclease McrA